MGSSVPGDSCRTNNRCCAPVPNTGCAVRVQGECVFYSGSNINPANIHTGDTFNTIVNNFYEYITNIIPSALAANEGLSIVNEEVVLGQSEGTVGDPAAITEDRYIPCSTFSIILFNEDNDRTFLAPNAIGFNTGFSYEFNTSPTCFNFTEGGTVYHGFDQTNKSFFSSDNGTIISNVSNAFWYVQLSNTSQHRFGINLEHVGVDNAFRGLTSNNFSSGSSARSEIIVGNNPGGNTIVGAASNASINFPSGMSYITAVNALMLGANGSIQFMQGTTGLSNEMARFITSPASLVGNFGLGVTSPTSKLHIRAGTATAGTSPLKFTAGVNLATPESGAMEFDGTNLYITIAGVRRTINVT